MLFSEEELIRKGKTEETCSVLIDILETWINDLKLERLGKYRIKIENVEPIIERTGLKNNPVKLVKEDIKKIVLNRL
ncbi:MAG: hypothetical protein KGD58_09590 [Candidatus Lokiarchaeota archaeon]|nr:hypothetical protein [Candidatus Lokiarchaeota archaeon]